MFKQLNAFFLHPQSAIVGLGFMSLSLLMGAWATRLPELKEILNITDGQIGTALLVLSIGALIISPFSSYIMDRYPTGKAAYISVLLQAVCYIFPFFVSTYFQLLTAMFLLGIANGFINITINASASIVEKKYNRSIMSSVHGMFSIGAIIGSLSAGFIAGFNISPKVHMVTLTIFIIIVNILFQKTWFNIPKTDLKAPLFAIPTLPVIGFTLITFCIVLAELTIMDWSAVYLKDSLNSGPILAGFGFAGFSSTMAIGRLSGDSIVPKIGKRIIIIYGCIIAAIGLALAAYTSAPFIAIFGFTICGIGMALIVPMIYSLSANLNTVSSGVGIASIATACVLAGLVGRPLVGTVSDNVGMSTSMWIAAGFALIGGLIGMIISKRKHNSLS